MVAREVCPTDADGGGTWNREKGTILFGAFGGIQRVSAAGGEPKPVLKLDASRQETTQLFPWFLPHGLHFLYYSGSTDSTKRGIRAGSLDGNTQPVMPEASNVAFVKPGHILFGRGTALMATPFDPLKLSVTGDAFPIGEGLARQEFTPYTGFGASEAGGLAWRSGRLIETGVFRYTRDGRKLGSVGEVRPIRQFHLSPDNRYAALEVPENDLWIMDLASGITTRLTYDGKDNSDAVWSTDGHNIVFASRRAGAMAVYRKVVGELGDMEILRSRERLAYPTQQFADGSILGVSLPAKAFSLLQPGKPQPQVLFESEFAKDGPQVSSDGRWIAYHSLETGRWEVYVAAFPSFTGRRRVSTAGGVQPHWRKDGRELFYVSPTGQLMAVPMKGGASPEAGPPVELFRVPLRAVPQYFQYEPTADGRTFYFLEQPDDSASPVEVLLNWTGAGHK